MNENRDHSEDVLEKWEVAEASRAVVRAGFWKLMDKIAGKEEAWSAELPAARSTWSTTSSSSPRLQLPGGGDGRIGNQAPVQAV